MRSETGEIAKQIEELRKEVQRLRLVLECKRKRMTVKVTVLDTNDERIQRAFISEIYTIQGKQFLVYDPGNPTKDIYPQFRWIKIDSLVPDLGKELRTDANGNKYYWLKPAVEAV